MRTLPLLILLSLLAAPARAAEPAREDVSSLFCDKMADKALYDKGNFESYKMLIPGNNGWIFRTSTDLMSDFTLTPEASRNLRALNEAFKKKGVTLVMLFLPTRGMVHGEHLRPEDMKKYSFSPDAAWSSYNAAAKAIREAGIHVVTLDRPAPGTPFFYRRDHHWASDGSRAAASVLADYVKKLPEYESIQKASFTPREGEAMDFHGVSKKVFQKFCGTEPPPERIFRISTERADAAGGEADLFGDPIPPQIALLGTSNSTPEPSYANFAGFLKEELSADILNMAVSGGGLDTAMISWLGSDDYKKNPAKIAIWELPSYYALSNHGNFFRETVPAVYGACAPDAAVASASQVQLAEKTTIALTRLADKGIYGADYFLYLGFPQAVSKPFSVSLLHQKDRDKFRFAHSTPYPQDREFYLRLEDEGSTPLDKVVLTVPQEMIGSTVDVRICRLPGEDDDVAAAPSPAPAATPQSRPATAETANDGSGVRGLFKKLKKM